LDTCDTYLIVGVAGSFSDSSVPAEPENPGRAILRARSPLRGSPCHPDETDSSADFVPIRVNVH